MSKITGLSTLGLVLLAMSGCVGTKYLSSGITDEGRVQQQDIVFPERDKAWRAEGTFPNTENLSKIRPGINKDNLYDLIGAPHFNEASKAREWDYIMKFYMPDQSVKVCQYKVIFDKNYNGQEFYWSPADCPPNTVDMVQPMLPIVKEQINLSADALFVFDKSGSADILPQGKSELANLTQKLRKYQQLGETQVTVTGHTDYKGDDAYNMKLSTIRAQTVRNYLINQGINPNIITAIGAGESQPIQQCSTSLPRQQEIDCLQPNRRVTLDMTVIQ